MSKIGFKIQYYYSYRGKMLKEALEFKRSSRTGQNKLRLELSRDNEEVGSIALTIDQRGVVLPSCVGFSVEKSGEGYGERLLLRGFSHAQQIAKDIGLNPKWAYIYYTLAVEDEVNVVLPLERKVTSFGFYSTIFNVVADQELRELQAEYPNQPQLGGCGSWIMLMEDFTARYPHP